MRVRKRRGVTAEERVQTGRERWRGEGEEVRKGRETDEEEKRHSEKGTFKSMRQGSKEKEEGRRGQKQRRRRWRE